MCRQSWRSVILLVIGLRTVIRDLICRLFSLSPHIWTNNRFVLIRLFFFGQIIQAVHFREESLLDSITEWLHLRDLGHQDWNLDRFKEWAYVPLLFLSPM